MNQDESRRKGKKVRLMTQGGKKKVSMMKEMMIPVQTHLGRDEVDR